MRIGDCNKKWELWISLGNELIKEGSPNQQLVFVYLNLRMNIFKFFKVMPENKNGAYIF